MNLESYIQTGDVVRVVYRSVARSGFTGSVVQVCPGELGERDFIILIEGQSLHDDGAVGVNEKEAIFTVSRGDSWVMYPSITSLATHRRKAEANLQKRRQRLSRDLPLFAGHIDAEKMDPEANFASERRSAERVLALDHGFAEEATSRRNSVRARVAPAVFSQLERRASRYPVSPLYRLGFWRKQDASIQATGEPDIPQAPAPAAIATSAPWLKAHTYVMWEKAPGGPRHVIVSRVGGTKVMLMIPGEPIRDYDPRDFPTKSVWVNASDLTPADTQVTMGLPDPRPAYLRDYCTQNTAAA